MRLVVGYDQDWAEQCYRRNLRQLIRPGENSLTHISFAGIDYFAKRMAETSIFTNANRLGNPWIQRDDALELTRLVLRRATRAQLQRCEDVANNLLILEGIIGRAGATTSLGPQFGGTAAFRFFISRKI